MSTKDRKEISESTPDAEQQSPKPMSRRALLRGAVTTMPVVLTLQSGAALARSSNMISASRYSSEDRHGRTLCLDTDSVNPMDGSDHLYDLGEPARAHVYEINEREYRIAPHRNARRITEEQICSSGRPGFYRGEYGWESVSGDDLELSGEAGEVGELGDDDGGGDEYWLNWQPVQDARYRRQWKSVRVRRGVLVSATALSSFAGSVRVTDL